MSVSLDLDALGLRAVNSRLNTLTASPHERDFEILNPKGRHAIACGLQAPIQVAIRGHAGFYCGGMNKHAAITIHGQAGVGVGENMMSGAIRVKGAASQSAGATAHGGLLVIEGDASSRCGIAMKGVEIVVGGSVGHMSGFMAHLGRLVVCGDAGEALGDSIYEAELYVRGAVESLGADCEEKDMTAEHEAALAALLERAEVTADATAFRRYGSARRLYHFDIDNADFY